MRQNKKQHTPLLYQSVDELVRLFVSKVFSIARSLVYKLLHDLFAGAEAVVESHLALLPETRTSHPISKMLRPAFQHRRVKAVLGANLAGALILAGTVSAAPGQLETHPEAELPVLTEETVVVTTESRFAKPVETIGMSQGFSRFHNGIDLRAPVGNIVHPVAKGQVVEVVYGKFGYGHYVLVQHEDGFASLYAHLGIIKVKVGDEVTQESQLGTVGLTGWTTGSHLHFELYQDGVAINPLDLVPIK